MASDTPIAGYPTKVANKNYQVIDHVGPTSYPTGGEAYPASNLNFGGFDSVDAGTDFSGTYQVRTIYNNNPIGSATPSVLLQWFVISTGLEVGNGVNLSTATVRLRIWAV
jgi:hypothetical protein